MLRTIRATLIILSFIGFGTSPNAQSTKEMVKIEALQVLPTRGALRVSAAYATIRNHSSSTVILTGAGFAGASKVELHTTLRDGNIMRMRKLDQGISISPGGSVALKPGGDHIMLLGLTSAIKPGQTVTLTFEFGEKGSVQATTRAAFLPPSADTDARGSQSSSSPTTRGSTHGN